MVVFLDVLCAHRNISLSTKITPLRLVYILIVADIIMKYTVRETIRAGNIRFETRVYKLLRNKEEVRVATFILVDGEWSPMNKEAQSG